MLTGAVQRRRLACTLEDLQALSPSADAVTLKRALQGVHSINLDDAHLDDVTQFGRDLEEEYHAIATAERTVAEHGSKREARAAVGELISLFERLAPDRIFPPPTNASRSFWARMRETGSPPLACYPDLRDRVAHSTRNLVSQRMALDGLRGQLVRLAPRCEALSGKLRSAVLAARFIVSACTYADEAPTNKTHYLSQARLLADHADRLTSLDAQLADVRQGQIALSRELEGLIELSDALGEELLPGFDAALAAAQASPDALGHARFALQGHHFRILKRLQETVS